MCMTCEQVCACVHVPECSCTCVCARTHHVLQARLRDRHLLALGGPPLGKAPTFREIPSSESLLQRALRGLVSSSVSLGSSRSVLRGAPSALRSMPTSRRPNRCSAEPSRGRTWAEAQGGHCCLLGGDGGSSSHSVPSAGWGLQALPSGHLGGDEVLESPQQPSVPREVHSVAVFHPGLQEAEAPLVDLGEGRGGVLVGPGGRWEEAAAVQHPPPASRGLSAAVRAQHRQVPRLGSCQQAKERAWGLDAALSLRGYFSPTLRTEERGSLWEQGPATLLHPHPCSALEHLPPPGHQGGQKAAVRAVLGEAGWEPGCTCGGSRGVGLL